MEFIEERSEVAYFMQRLYRQHLTTTSGGNISMRCADDVVAMTPAKLDKGRTAPEQVGLVSMSGEPLVSGFRATSEANMHLTIYRNCPRVGAVVHAHPVTASAFTAANTPINTELLAEAYAFLGRPVFAPYALTATQELADVVAECAQRADCILMENHGITCLGEDLLRAFDRLELLEVAAKMTLIVRQLDGVHALSEPQRRELDALIGREPLDG